MWLYDVFISHASEDKEALVRPLAHALRELHVEVWYDEFTLRLGDSLRRSIDRGLLRSRFAIVVLSPDFFRKNWPQRELDGLVAREVGKGQRLILPVWHGVTHDDVLEFSPPLADVLGIDSRQGIQEVAKKICQVVRPRGSPLVAARDFLLKKGLTPPVITDEWWLDVVEASNREYPWGYMPYREHWGRWSFWLPEDDSEADWRGEKLAWTALQLKWTAEAAVRPITQITRPEEVLDFIREQPGLAEMCHREPWFLANYAPQLTIPGLGGEFEEDFERLFHASLRKSERHRETSPEFGSALTTNSEGPLCDAEIAWRHPSFGNLQPDVLASQFFMGAMSGPPVQYFATFDYVAWVLSESSFWLPERVRETLKLGLAAWASWYWGKLPTPAEGDFEFTEYPERGMLFNEMFYAAEENRAFELSNESRVDLVIRLKDSCHILGLPEPAEELAVRFLRGNFIEEFIADRRRVVGKSKD